MPSLSVVALLAVACVAAGLPQGVQAQSFWESQFSTSEFAQYRYKDLVTVSIFQHLKKNASFYISPLVLLDHRSGVTRYNSLTELFELRFRVLMWDTELHDSVVAYLTSVKGVAFPEVKMLPMEKVRFQWLSRSRPIRRDIVMETEFISTHHLPRFLTLTFACKKTAKGSCDALHRQVRQQPEVLDSLAMDCFMTAQKAATKTITVTVDNVLTTQTYSKLALTPPDGNYWYLRADDFSNLAQEIFSNVRATTMRSSEYVEKYDELNVMKLIEDALKQDEIYSSTLTASQWNSVFWDPTFARPDRVASEAAKTFRKNATTNRLDVNKDYLRSSDAASKLFDKDSRSSGLGLSAKVGWESSSSGRFGNDEFSSSAGGSVSGSLDYSSSRGSESQRDRSDAATKRDSYSSSELNDKLQEENLNVQWEGDRFVVKPMRLVRFNRQSFRSRRQLVSHSMQLSIFEQVTSLKVIVRASHNESWLLPAASTQAGFPTQFSYCLLSNGGSCPPGFTRSSSYMKAINIDTSTPGMIQSARLGDSGILCHSPGESGNCGFRGWEPYKGELHLHVCCR